MRRWHRRDRRQRRPPALPRSAAAARALGRAVPELRTLCCDVRHQRRGGGRVAGVQRKLHPLGGRELASKAVARVRGGDAGMQVPQRDWAPPAQAGQPEPQLIEVAALLRNWGAQAAPRIRARVSGCAPARTGRRRHPAPGPRRTWTHTMPSLHIQQCSESPRRVTAVTKSVARLLQTSRSVRRGRGRWAGDQGDCQGPQAGPWRGERLPTPRRALAPRGAHRGAATSRG